MGDDDDYGRRLSCLACVLPTPRPLIRASMPGTGDSNLTPSDTDERRCVLVALW